MKYLWARHKTGRTLILLPVVGLYLLLLFVYHRTPYQIMTCLAVGSWISVVALLISVFWRKKTRD